MHSPFTLSVIVEWDNVRVSELDRAREMLRQLLKQLREIADLPSGADASPEDAFLSKLQVPVELLVMFNSEELEAAAVAKVVDSLVGDGEGLVEPRLVPAPGATYYELKNQGAAQASGDLFLFLDSDVIPEQGWLRHLLWPFADPSVEVVGGNAYVTRGDRYSRAFGAVWFFDGRARENAFKPAWGFHANNVVFRRATFERYPFPPQREGITRGACYQLAQQLTGRGIGLYENSAARVSHPAPNGLRHFVVRGIAQGRDDLYLDHPDRDAIPLGEPLRQTVRRLRRAHRNIQEARAHGDLRSVDALLAYGLAATYYTAHLGGGLGTAVRPQTMMRHFQI